MREEDWRDHAIVRASYRGVDVETQAESWVNCGEWDVETSWVNCGGWRQVAPPHRLLGECVGPWCKCASGRWTGWRGSW